MESKHAKALSWFRRICVKSKVYWIFTIGILGFLIAFFSLNSVYIGENFSDIGLEEFFLESTVPITFWIGLILITISLLCLVNLLESKVVRLYFLFLCASLVLCMRGTLYFTVSKPFAYDVVNQYIPWMKVWLTEGILLAPSPSINTPLIYYYPNHHPLAFLVAYAFLRIGVPIDFFFKWATIALYVIDVYLVYLIAKEIDPSDAKLGGMSAFLFSVSSASTFFTIWYCPQLFGSAFFLLSILLIIRFSKMRKRNLHMFSTFALTLIAIFLLIVTHHISTLCLIITLAGVNFTEKFLAIFGHKQEEFRISKIWPLYTFAVWFAHASITYPHKLYDWVINVALALRGMAQHAYQSVGPINLLNMPTLDQASFICYPILIGGLTIYGIFGLSRKYLTTKNIAIITFGLNSLLFSLFILGFVTRGLTYPIRIMEVILALSCPLAAKVFMQLFWKSTSRKTKLIIGVIMIMVVFFNTHWLFRIIQRTIPSWTSEYWLR